MTPSSAVPEQPALGSIVELSAAPKFAARLAAWGELRWAAVSALVALAVTMMAIEPGLPVGTWVDDGHYVILARALATGRGYRYLNLPGEPFGTHFPPGYPALLAVITRIVPEFPLNVRAFTFANALLAAATAWGIVALGHRRLGLSLPLAALSAVTWAVAVPSLMLSTAVMSEPLFLALLLPAVLLAERAARDGGDRTVVAACLMLAACTLVRSIGIAAFGALAIVLVTRRRWRALGTAVVTGAAALAPWLVWKRLHQTPLPSAWAGMYGDYDAWLGDGLASHGISLLGKVAVRNARDIVEAFAGYWSAGPDGVFRTVLAVVLIAVTCAGIATSWRRVPVVVWTVVGYFAVVLVWPFHPQRFVWGLGALWIPLCWVGGWRVWESIPASNPRSQRAIAAAVLSALAVAIPVGLARAVPTRAWNRVPRSGVETAGPMVRWIAQNVPPDSIIASDAETTIYLYTGRRALPFVPFMAADRVGLMTAEDAYGGLAEVLRLYHPRWVFALTLPSVRVASHFTTQEGAPLRMVFVPKFGAVFETRVPPAGGVVPTSDPATAR